MGWTYELNELASYAKEKQCLRSTQSHATW